MKSVLVGMGCLGPVITGSGPVCRYGLFPELERPDCQACREAAQDAYHEAMSIYEDMPRRGEE